MIQHEGGPAARPLWGWADAQAKRLADRVRTLGRLARSSGSNPDKSQAMLDTAGSTALLLRGWQRRNA